MLKICKTCGKEQAENLKFHGYHCWRCYGQKRRAKDQEYQREYRLKKSLERKLIREQERATFKTKLCRECLEVKPWVCTNRKYGKSYIYTDHSTAVWKGKICPSCHIKRLRRKYRRQRNLPLEGDIIRLRSRNEKGQFLKGPSCILNP
jgi:hypothetical protein